MITAHSILTVVQLIQKAQMQREDGHSSRCKSGNVSLSTFLLQVQGTCSSSLRRNMQGNMSASAHRSSSWAPFWYLQVLLRFAV